MIRAPHRTLTTTVVITLALAATPARVVDAHEPGLSSSIVRIERGEVEITSTFNDRDLALQPASETAPAAPLLRPATLEHTAIPRRAHDVATRDGHSRVRSRYAYDGAQPLRVELDSFGALPHGHKHYVEVMAADGRRIATRVLGATSPGLEIEPFADAASSGALGTIALGFHHIVGGVDHLLYLLALLIGCTRLATALRLVTAFTIAHSASLAAAALGWLELPASVVEPAIAASILYVAVANVAAGGRRTETLAVTFAIGLVHGLGFAGALSDLGIGGGGALRTLLLFNVGVEVGQAAVVALALPVLALVRTSTSWETVGARVCTGAIAVAGGYWLVERTLLG